MPDVYTDEASDPDLNFYNEKLQELNSEYYSVEEISKFSEKLEKDTFSIFHLNIRSLNKNIDKLKDLLSFLKGKFSIIVLTETWADETAKNNSIFRIPNYVAIHQIRNCRRGGGISFFIRKGINFKVRNVLSKCTSNAEIFSIEIENKNSKNMVISGVYKAPCADFKLFKTDFKEIITKVSPNKSFFLAGDFNINSLDYSTNSTVKQFFNLAFRNSLIPLINRPTRVSRKTATCIDHILTNSFIDSEIMSGIIKTDISDHFAIFCTVKTNENTILTTSPHIREI